MFDLLSLLKKQKKQKCTAVIVAAGKATRMQGEDKILSVVAGKTVIDRSIEAFENCSLVDEIVLVTRPDLVERFRKACDAMEYKKVRCVTAGGETRVESVIKGLDCVTEKSGLVAIHDGARPLVTDDVIVSAIKKGREYHASAPAIPVKDTIKVANNHMVVTTPDRASMFAVQTPQVFDFDLLRGALQNALNKNLSITDDCSAVEALGMHVYLGEGSEENIKITTPMDLILAEAILKRRAEA